MSTPRPGTAGATRSCPHCKTTILESASVCPACKHHLRFDEAAITARRAAETIVPLRVQGTSRPDTWRAKVEDMMERVGLARTLYDNYPSQLSGGQRQRVAIARALINGPRMVICDEPTSALDVSVQAAILNLLVELQAEHRVSYLFISHDLGVVRYISDRIAVLYLGRLMELGPADVVFDGPHHPYTEALLSAVPTVDGGGRERIRLEGDIPSAADPPSGCVFHNRCPRRIGPICDETEPPLVEVEPDHLMRCHIPIDELRALQLPAPAATEA
jgi:peptide/nickel transport system ATP-binding protein